jgi:nitrite reductase (NADH) large subunit
MKRYVVIGHGVAGATAVERIKDVDPDGRIAIITEEHHPFYYRPRLPEVMAGEADIAKITLRRAEWYAERDIDLRLREKVIDGDAGRKTVTTDQGRTEEYDELLLATGAHPFIPPVPGADRPGVFALRTADDALAIGRAAAGTDRAVLMGGGLLGLEAGAALTRLGLKVQVVEMADRLLPRQMDPAGAAKLQSLLRGMGFSFSLGVQAKEIVGDGAAQGVVLQDGSRLEGGLILFSAGIRGNVALAEKLGLAMDKGVKVDDRMQTNLDGIWAAGDQIEHRGRLYGIWPASRDQGEVAGINMAGGRAEYHGTTMSNSLKVVGVDLTSAGDIDPDGKLEAAVYEDEKTYRKIVLADGRIKGLIFFGVTEGVKEALAALDRGAAVGRFKEDMTRRDFDFGRLTQPA